MKFIKKPSKRFEKGYCYFSCMGYCESNSSCMPYNCESLSCTGFF
ncbi:hypothetical protein UT300012_27460 [Paraclostridium bifermentans]|jgi:Cys-rich peptide (Clo7bot family)|nr:MULTISPECIES: hypothetical protein [Paraclostridium]MDM8127680.1 hypothetical protein [Paraclostridium benzoelyticum]